MVEIAKMKPPTKPTEIKVTLSPEDFDLVHRFAYRSGMSVAQVAKLGIKRLIIDAETGEIPLLPEYRTGYQPGRA